MRFVVHRGTHEIGGSCVEIFSNKSRILIDIGIPLMNPDGSSFDCAATIPMSGPDMVRSKILPDVKGLYKWDAQDKRVNGVLISHPHLDHYGFFSYLRNDIHYYLGEASRRMIDTTVAFTSAQGSISKYTPLQSGKPFSVGDFKVTPYLMDHSAFDSYGFLIEANGKKLFYSGDFRGHGRKKRAFDWFLLNGPKNVDALLMEGTMLGRIGERTRTEAQLETEIVDISKRTKNIVLAYASSQNIDRLVTLYRAAIKSRRLMVVDVYTANVLDQIRHAAALPHPSRDYPLMKVCFPYWLCQRLSKEGKQQLMYRFKQWKITKQQIARDRHKIIMLVRPSMRLDLMRIPGIQKGAFIYSMWEGYLKGEGTSRFLDFATKKGMTIHKVHTSGHATTATLKKLVKSLSPKNIVPIHTMEPERYGEFFGNVRQVRDGEVFQVGVG